MKKIIFLLCLILPNLGISQINNGLLVHYEFNGNTQDSSGNEINGIPNQLLFGYDRFGNSNSAALFNGESSFVDIPYQEILLNQFSYSLWVKVNDIPEPGETQLLFSIGGQGGDQTIQICNQAGASNNLTGWYGGGYSTDGTLLRITDGIIPDTSTWNHIVLTRDIDFLKLYINCILIDSLDTSILPSYGNGQNYSARIGSRYNLNNFFSGFIDDFKIFNRTLLQNEIDALCQEIPTNINNIEKEKRVNIYPIPNKSGNLNIESTNIKFDELRLYTLAGRLERIYEIQSDVNPISISLINQNTGIFILKFLKDNKVVFSSKIVKN